MLLKKRIKNIKTFLIKRYGYNLAAILLFGSANTGHYKEGKSDIDVIILLKNKLDFEKEDLFLCKIFKKEKLKIVHLKTIGGYKEHIYKKGSWASWITVIDGSKKIYSTKQFSEFRDRLIKKSIPKKKLINYLKEKDNFELNGYLKKEKGFALTKGLMSHIRRKIQILSFQKTKKPIFDFKKCLKNINLEKQQKERLEKLYKYYDKRKRLSKKQVREYYQLAKEMTKKLSLRNN